MTDDPPKPQCPTLVFSSYIDEKGGMATGTDPQRLEDASRSHEQVRRMARAVFADGPRGRIINAGGHQFMRGSFEGPMAGSARESMDAAPAVLARAAGHVTTVMEGRVERLSVSEAGYYLVEGWLDDEGGEAPTIAFIAGDLVLEVPRDSVMRHARPDVEKHFGEGPYDYGFLAFGCSASPSDLKQSLRVEIRSASQLLSSSVTPRFTSDKRALDKLLILASGVSAHTGHEGNLQRFLAGDAGRSAIALFQAHVARCTADYEIRRFRPRAAARSFITVLFGSTEPILTQPVLFRQQNIDVGEWIYVCNSPEDGDAVMRLCGLMSDLYDLMITVIVLPGNIGFGAANNLAVSQAAGDAIYLINPDVYPAPGHAAALRESLEQRKVGSTLWGGLLFYDPHTLMHSGMYLEQDVFTGTKSSVGLLRVEHFDKGVPFEDAKWRRPKAVPAITGAVMAFHRPYFEKLGGFSARYIYGHYEDADLSVRWTERNWLVAVDPKLRLVHLEGQGSKPRGAQYRGAAIFNRHLFTLQHSKSYAKDNWAMTVARDLAIGET